MPKWTDYTIKTEPADKDEVMILDASGKANKRLGLSALSDWIIGKIANKVFENLQTQNKTILGALNELNSNSFFNSKYLDETADLNTISDGFYYSENLSVPLNSPPTNNFYIISVRIRKNFDKVQILFSVNDQAIYWRIFSKDTAVDSERYKWAKIVKTL